MSGGPPARVRFVAWYFEATGALTLLALLATTVAAPFGIQPFAATRASAGAVLVRAIAGLGWLWTGRSLAAGERRGAVVAALTLVVPLLARAAGQAVSASTLIVGFVGVAAVLSAWRDLRGGGWHEDGTQRDVVA